jgi:hypothetical protein
LVAVTIVSFAGSIMRKVLMVDDLRTFSVEEETAFGSVAYARTSEAALHAVALDWDDIHLDHDLGGDDTVRPVVLELERIGYERAICGKGLDHRLPAIHIVSSNPVGRQYIRQALKRYYDIVG